MNSGGPKADTHLSILRANDFQKQKNVKEQSAQINVTKHDNLFAKEKDINLYAVVSKFKVVRNIGE